MEKERERERELIEVFEAAKKAADAAALDLDSSASEESRCLDALQLLFDFPVNYQLLVSTQVGKRLRSLTKHPRKKIQKLASDLIEIWKSIIIEETSKKKNGNLGVNNSANSDSTKKATPAKVEKVPRNENVKVEKNEQLISPKQHKLSNAGTGPVERKFQSGNGVKIENSTSGEPVKADRIVKQDKVGSIGKKPAEAANVPPKLTCMIKCNDASRDRIREHVLESLSKVYSEADESMKAEVDACDPIRVAISVESVMFEKWGSNSGAHKAKYRSICFNLRDANNPDFRRKVLLGEIEAERIVNLSPGEMASDQRKMENKQIEKKMMFDCERGGPPKATTDQFKCGRCGQRKCTYYQMQTRSADEPMTTFVTCVNCNNHWKFC